MAAIALPAKLHQLPWDAPIEISGANPFKMGSDRYKFYQKCLDDAPKTHRQFADATKEWPLLRSQLYVVMKEKALIKGVIRSCLSMAT